MTTVSYCVSFINSIVIIHQIFYSHDVTVHCPAFLDFFRFFSVSNLPSLDIWWMALYENLKKIPMNNVHIYCEFYIKTV